MVHSVGNDLTTENLRVHESQEGGTNVSEGVLHSNSPSLHIHPGMPSSRNRWACEVCLQGDATIRRRCKECGHCQCICFECCTAFRNLWGDDCHNLPHLCVPYPWKAETDQAGRIYFWNQESLESSWLPLQEEEVFDHERLSYMDSAHGDVDSHTDGIARSRLGSGEEPEPEDAVPRLVVLWDLNEALVFRPWVKGASSTEIPGARADFSMLPVGRSDHALRVYHRRGDESIFREMFGRCIWGFYTTMARGNALNIIKRLFWHALDATVIDDTGGFELHVEYHSSEGTSVRERFLLFDMADCQDDGQTPQAFQLTTICEKAALNQACVVLVTAVERKCRLGDCRDHWLPCKAFKEDQVRDSQENGLENMRLSIRILASIPPTEILSRLQAMREELLALRSSCTRSLASLPSGAETQLSQQRLVDDANASGYIVCTTNFRFGCLIVGISVGTVFLSMLCRRVK